MPLTSQIYLTQLVAAGASSFGNCKIIPLPTSSQKERDVVKVLTGVEVAILNNESAAVLGEMVSGVSPDHVGRTSGRYQLDAGAVTGHISSIFSLTADFLDAHESVAIFAPRSPAPDLYIRVRGSWGYIRV